MLSGFKTMKDEIESKDWFVIPNWTQNLENARFYDTFKEALQSQTESNMKLIEEDRLNESDMYEVFRTSGIS